MHPLPTCPGAARKLRPRVQASLPQLCCRCTCVQPCCPDLLIRLSRLISGLACLSFLWWSLDCQWDLSTITTGSAHLIQILWACALLVRAVLCLCYDHAQLPACPPSWSSPILTALWYYCKRSSLKDLSSFRALQMCLMNLLIKKVTESTEQVKAQFNDRAHDLLFLWLPRAIR